MNSFSKFTIDTPELYAKFKSNQLENRYDLVEVLPTAHPNPLTEVVIFAETLFPHPGTTIKFIDESGNIVMINRSKRSAYAHHEQKQCPFGYLPFSYDLYKITIGDNANSTEADANAIARLPRAADIEISFNEVSDEFQQRLYVFEDHRIVQNLYKVRSAAVDGPL